MDEVHDFLRIYSFEVWSFLAEIKAARYLKFWNYSKSSYYSIAFLDIYFGFLSPSSDSSTIFYDDWLNYARANKDWNRLSIFLSYL